MHRVILHLNNDDSCALVEQRDEPALKDKSVMVGSLPNQRVGS